MRLVTCLTCLLTLWFAVPAALAEEHEGEAREEHEAPKVTYLGVSTMPVPDMLRAHLDLQPSAGLLVMHVAEASPAAEAGLERFDVIEKLDDQRLVNHDQLASLIHAAEPGDEVTLHLIHAGQRKQLKVTLGEREDRRRHHRPRHHFDRPPHHGKRPPGPRIRLHPGVDLEALEDRLRDSGLEDEQVERMLDRIHKQMQRLPEHMRREHHLEFEEHEREAPPEAIIQQHIRMSYADDDHRLTITREGDEKHLHAETLDGEELFDGPINTPDQRREVPEMLREKLERLERQSRVRIHIAPPPHRDDEPRGEREKPPL